MMFQGLGRLDQVINHVEHDATNVEKYVKRMAAINMGTFRASGARFELEHLKFLSMFAATGFNESSRAALGATGAWLQKGIIEHKVIQNLKDVKGDKGFFRQWRQKFVTAIGQVNGDCEAIIHTWVKYRPQQGVGQVVASLN